MVRGSIIILILLFIGELCCAGCGCCGKNKDADIYSGLLYEGNSSTSIHEEDDEESESNNILNEDSVENRYEWIEKFDVGAFKTMKKQIESEYKKRFEELFKQRKEVFDSNLYTKKRTINTIKKCEQVGQDGIKFCDFCIKNVFPHGKTFEIIRNNFKKDVIKIKLERDLKIEKSGECKDNCPALSFEKGEEIEIEPSHYFIYEVIDKFYEVQIKQLKEELGKKINKNLYSTIAKQISGYTKKIPEGLPWAFGCFQRAFVMFCLHSPKIKAAVQYLESYKETRDKTRRTFDTMIEKPTCRDDELHNCMVMFIRLLKLTYKELEKDNINTSRYGKLWNQIQGLEYLMHFLTFSYRRGWVRPPLIFVQNFISNMLSIRSFYSNEASKNFKYESLEHVIILGAEGTSKEKEVDYWIEEGVCNFLLATIPRHCNNGNNTHYLNYYVKGGKDLCLHDSWLEFSIKNKKEFSEEEGITYGFFIPSFFSIEEPSENNLVDYSADNNSYLYDLFVPLLSMENIPKAKEYCTRGIYKVLGEQIKSAKEVAEKVDAKNFERLFPFIYSLTKDFYREFLKDNNSEKRGVFDENIIRGHFEKYKKYKKYQKQKQEGKSILESKDINDSEAKELEREYKASLVEIKNFLCGKEKLKLKLKSFIDRGEKKELTQEEVKQLFNVLQSDEELKKIFLGYVKSDIEIFIGNLDNFVNKLVIEGNSASETYSKEGYYEKNDVLKVDWNNTGLNQSDFAIFRDWYKKYFFLKSHNFAKT